MAVAAVVTPRTRPSWNPLDCTSTELPVHLLLMAKLLVVAFVVRGEWVRLPDVYLPLVPVLDVLPPRVFAASLRLAFALAAVGLLLNRHVRASCLVLGLVILLALIGARGYYRNSKVFVSAIFLVTGLQQPGGTPWLYHWQLALVYFGAGLNKLFEPDWWNGQYFEHWTREILGHRSAIYLFVAELLPDRWFSTAAGWITIAVELVALPVTLLVARLRRWAVWIAIALHGGTLFLVRQEFEIFFAAVVIALMSIVPWPRDAVLLAGAGGVERMFVWFARRLDTCRLITVEGSNAGGLSLRTPERTHVGFAAVQRVTALLPPLYLLGVYVVTAPGISGIGKYVVTAAAVAMYLPTTPWLVDRIRALGRRTAASASPT